MVRRKTNHLFYITINSEYIFRKGRDTIGGNEDVKNQKEDQWNCT
jgi:hypothetical protein